MILLSRATNQGTEASLHQSRDLHEYLVFGGRMMFFAAGDAQSEAEPAMQNNGFDISGQTKHVVKFDMFTFQRRTSG